MQRFRLECPAAAAAAAAAIAAIAAAVVAVAAVAFFRCCFAVLGFKPQVSTLSLGSTLSYPLGHFLELSFCYVDNGLKT